MENLGKRRGTTDASITNSMRDGIEIVIDTPINENTKSKKKNPDTKYSENVGDNKST